MIIPKVKNKLQISSMSCVKKRGNKKKKSNIKVVKNNASMNATAD